jgi:hypothetical protein
MAEAIKCKILIFYGDDSNLNEYDKFYEEFKDKTIDEICFIAFSENKVIEYKKGTITEDIFTETERNILLAIKDEKEKFKQKLFYAKLHMLDIYSSGNKRMPFNNLMVRSLFEYRNALKKYKKRIFIYI